MRYCTTHSTKYVMGISIDQVQLKNINPPQPVQESFNEVNQAQQEKEKLINEARRDYNKVIPLAEGEKDQRIREADGYRLKRINEAEGDVARFSAILAEYTKAPEVTGVPTGLPNWVIITCSTSLTVYKEFIETYVPTTKTTKRAI